MEQDTTSTEVQHVSVPADVIEDIVVTNRLVLAYTVRDDAPFLMGQQLNAFVVLERLEPYVPEPDRSAVQRSLARFRDKAREV